MTNDTKYANVNNTTMRQYNMSDVNALVGLLVKYLPELPNYRTVAVDPSRVRFVLEHNLNNESTVMCRVLCDSHDNIVGGMVAYCNTAFFSWEKVAQDIFLFVVPEFRSLKNAQKLIRMYVEWAKLRKPVLITATVLSGYEPEAMDMLMRREKFQKMGMIYHYVGDKK